MPARGLGRPGNGSPRVAHTAGLRTQRLRYQQAFPSRSDTPCTMPSPLNQWYVAGSTSAAGLGPLRR